MSFVSVFWEPPLKRYCVFLVAVVIAIRAVWLVGGYWGVKHQADVAQSSITCAPLGISFSDKIVTRSIPPVNLDQCADLTDSILLSNASERPFELAEVARSCSCTDPSFHKGLIEPGEMTEIVAKVNLPFRPGPWSYTLTPKTTDGRSFQIVTRTILFKRIEPELDSVLLQDLKPQSFSNFVFRVSVCRLSTDPGIKLKYMSNRGLFTILSAIPITHTEQSLVRDVYSLNLRLLPDSEGRIQEDTLQLSIADSQESAVQTIPIRWKAASFFTVAPSRAFFSIPSGSTKGVIQTIVITSSDRRFAPKIASDAVLENGLSAVIKPTQISTKWLLDLSVDPTLLRGESARHQVVLATGIPEEPKLYLPVTLFRGFTDK